MPNDKPLTPRQAAHARRNHVRNQARLKQRVDGTLKAPSTYPVEYELMDEEIITRGVPWCRKY